MRSLVMSDRKNMCAPCRDKAYEAQYGKLPKLSEQVRKEQNARKREEAIEQGKICRVCRRGCPDPGHEFCHGCEHAHKAKASETESPGA